MLLRNNKPNCREICEDTFLQLGFNYSSLGTKYLIDSIVYLYENKIDSFSMKDIYSKLSQKTGTSIRNIKWNIEKAVNSMYRFSRRENLVKFFPNYDGRKPTPKYTISMALYELNKIRWKNMDISFVAKLVKTTYFYAGKLYQQSKKSGLKRKYEP